MLTTITIQRSQQERGVTLTEIRQKLAQQKKSLPQAISERELYFRVSLVGTCNLSCPFCHNEGAPVRDKMKLDFSERAIKAAREIGFTRVQFTGGEPLLHPEVATFVEIAKGIVPDVGITTNGTYLEKNIENLIRAGITRIHISLQVETLREAGEKGLWGVPSWLNLILSYSSESRFFLRLNMPVPIDELTQARLFLERIASYQCDLKVFSILPEGANQNTDYSLDELANLVEVENERRLKAGQSGKVLLRGYLPPSGIRCIKCPDMMRCKEQSHSLRLGADHMLRPCLATRQWDSLLEDNTRMLQEIEEAALLALDYWW